MSSIHKSFVTKTVNIVFSNLLEKILNFWITVYELAVPIFVSFASAVKLSISLAAHLATIIWARNIKH